MQQSNNREEKIVKTKYDTWKKIDAEIACEIAISKDATKEELDINKRESKRKDKWRTEVNAIKHFKSTCNVAIITEHITPIKAIDINQIEEELKRMT